MKSQEICYPNSQAKKLLNANVLYTVEYGYIIYDLAAMISVSMTKRPFLIYFIDIPVDVDKLRKDVDVLVLAT